MTTSSAFSLADAVPGTTVLVVEVDRASPVGGRLLDLGLVPGTQVKVLRRAPLGDPVVYELRGYRLCLRRSEASRIRVRVPGPVLDESR